MRAIVTHALFRQNFWGRLLTLLTSPLRNAHMDHAGIKAAIHSSISGNHSAPPDQPETSKDPCSKQIVLRSGHGVAKDMPLWSCAFMSEPVMQSCHAHTPPTLVVRPDW